MLFFYFTTMKAFNVLFFAAVCQAWIWSSTEKFKVHHLEFKHQEVSNVKQNWCSLCVVIILTHSKSCLHLGLPQDSPEKSSSLQQHHILRGWQHWVSWTTLGSWLKLLWTIRSWAKLFWNSFIVSSFKDSFVKSGLGTKVSKENCTVDKASRVQKWLHLHSMKRNFCQTMQHNAKMISVTLRLTFYRTEWVQPRNLTLDSFW